MKKILLFIVEMLCFAGVVEADIYPHAELSFSKKLINVGEEVYYEFNDFMNYTDRYIIKYDKEHLEYVQYYCMVDDVGEGMGSDCETKCEVDSHSQGVLIFTCDNSLKSEELLHISFKAIKPTDGEEITIL